MTTYLTWLEKSVEEKLAAGAIGKPVFVRLVLALTTDHGLLDEGLHRAVTMADRWMRGTNRYTERMGGAREGYVCALVEYEDGQTALLAAELFRTEPEARVLIVGQHGTLRFDDFPGVA